MKTCKNCLFWKQLKSEKELGICFKANGGKKNPKIEAIGDSPSNKSIIVRFADGSSIKPLNVYFGKDYGCIAFEKIV